MGVVSDWGHGLEAILLELELGRYFEFVVVSSRLRVAKPDPRVFNMALARVDARSDQAVYIGDTYVKDVIGARAAGIAPVLLDRSGRAPEVDCPRIESLDELLELVGADRPDAREAIP
jgi:FMN phosphatase YigB (HAD superfamily)